MPVGRRLVGRVLSGDSDAPLAGILVRLTAANNETTLLAESDAAGTITVPAPEGRYTISVEHPTLVLASPAVCTHGATAEPFTIRLYEGGSLVGQVLDRATREAVANVLVHAETHGSLNAREVVTAEDGTFRLDGLSVSPLSSEITWRVPGFLPAPRANPNRILVSSGAVREGYVLLIDRGAIVQGQVFDESGAALQGATVHLLSRRGGAGSSSTLTDAAGEYLLTVPPGRYHLRATYDGLALVEGPFQVDWDGQQRDLTLSTEARVSGVLVDERDTPLARQVVHFRSKRTLSLEASAKTDDDGYFVAQNLTAGAYAVSGTYGDSDNRADAPPITVGAGEHLEDVVVVVQLNRAGAIRGRITDTYGRPAPHEFVRLTKDGKSHYGNTNALGEFEFLGLRDVVYTLAWRKERRQVAAGTDNVLLQEPRAEDSQMVTVKVLDGSGAPVHLFGFQVVRALSGTTATKATDHNEAAIHLTRAFSERVEVRVEAPEVGRGELVLEPDADGASELIVELRLTPAFAASVCVVDESGNPLADATVHDGPIGGDATRVLGRSLPDGTLRFDRAGLQQVFVTHPDFAPSVHALPTAGSVQLRLLQGVHVSGRVHDGARPAAFDVTIDCPGVGRLQILTDADGRFEARVPAGENQLGVMLRTTAELTSVRRLFQALGGEAGDSVDVEVVVPPMDAALSLGVLRGTVPVVNAMVQLRMELPGRLGLWLNAQADDQGNCLLENLPAGAVVVNVMDPAATQSMQAVTANATLIGGSTTRLEVQADSAPAGAATVRGTISTQRSGENVIVLLVPGEVTRGQVTLQGLQQLQANSIASRVDAGGSFEIVGVASGRHTLLALAIAGNIGTPQEFAQKTRIALVPVVVEGAGVSVVDLQLPVSGGSQ